MMKRRALRKEFLMEIRTTLTRFLSIFLIVALGTAFYAGLQTSAPDMIYTGDAYFDDQELMDLEVISTLGLTDEDVEALAALDGIKAAEASCMTDVLTGDEENQETLRIASLTEQLNLAVLEEGRLPQAADECLLDSDYAKDRGYQVGDTIVVRETAKEEDEVLQTHTYTITGIGSSPLYISFSRGSTDIGTGEVAGFAFVPQEAFTTDYVMMIYLQVRGAKEATAYEEEYTQIVAHAREEVAAIEEERCAERDAQIRREAQDAIDEAEQELADGRQEADEELARARRELDEAEQELADGRAELDDAREELADGRQELDDAQAALQDGEQELAEGRAQIEDGYRQLEEAEQELAVQEAAFEEQNETALQEIESGEQELAAGEQELARQQAVFDSQKATFEEGKQEYEASLAEYEEQKAAYESGTVQLAEGRRQYEESETELKQAREIYEALAVLAESGYASAEQQEQAERMRTEIAAGEQELAAAKEELDATEATLTEAKAGLDVWKTQLDAAAKELESAEKELNEGEVQLAQARQELDAGEQELAQARQELAQAEQELAAARQMLASERETLAAGEAEVNAAQEELASARQEIAAGEQEIADGEQELADGEAELADGEQELADGWKEYEDAEAEAEAELADGEREIQDARAQLDEIGTAQWTVSDRTDVLEYTEYGDNADRMRSIGRVFPVIFFLVAALISLTTMTRMVEEERTQIGTYKALGYGNGTIAAKYLLYALFATLGGSIVGVLIGEKIFPYVIIRAYGIMYQNMNTILLPYNLTYALIATAAAVVCTMAATAAACAQELRDWPATLMRPPTPKSGKRVWLEHVTVLWRHLSFTWKVTIRNLFRYKGRFWMTVLGIGGCMGLLLVGFGLRDSIMEVVTLQYSDLQMYDGMVILDEDATPEQTAQLEEGLSRDGDVEGCAQIYMKKLDLSSDEGVEETYLVILPDEISDSDFFCFRRRGSKEEYTLGSEGAILTEKTADILSVSEGDSVYIRDGEEEVEIPVERICENYMYHYLYLSQSLYRELVGEVPQNNMMIYSVSGRDEELTQEVGKRALSYDAALSITYTSTLKEELQQMLTSLNLVILVLILSAGMLAFVVLYNLSNININERRRELATIKVLGFYDGEVSAYVYRENILLTAVGAVLGIVVGIILHRFVIVTVEVDMCMFGRDIHLASYLISILITVGFSVVVNFVMHFKLKKIDMVESLKSVE